MKKKIRLLIVIGALVVICVIAFFASGDFRAYRKAEGLLEDRKYNPALEELRPLGKKDYKDSKKLMKYLEARKLISESQFYDGQERFEELKGFKDSENYAVYCDTAKLFKDESSFSKTTIENMMDGFAKAGDTEHADQLTAFLRGVAAEDYGKAIEEGKKYREDGGKLLTAEKLAAISTGANYTVEGKKERELEMAISLTNAMAQIDKGVVKQLSSSSSQTGIRLGTLDIPGMGTSTRDLALIVDIDISYRGMREIQVYPGKSLPLMEDNLPEEIGDIRYLIKVYTVNNHEKDYVGDGKRIPGITQHVYTELYDAKKDAVIFKSKKIKSGKLEKTYVFREPTPLFVSAPWPDRQEEIKALINKTADKIPH